MKQSGQSAQCVKCHAANNVHLHVLRIYMYIRICLVYVLLNTLYMIRRTYIDDVDVYQIVIMLFLHGGIVSSMAWYVLLP